MGDISPGVEVLDERRAVLGPVLPWSEECSAGLSGYRTPILNLDSNSSLTSMGTEGTCLEKGRGSSQAELEAVYALGRPLDHRDIGDVNVEYTTKAIGTVANGL